jgi:hypothetical protein
VRPFRDEHIAVPASISATMPEMTKMSNKPQDIYDVRGQVDTRKTPIKYAPKPGEMPNQNPFGNW